MTTNISWSDKQIFWLFITGHLIVWTLVPSLTNHNLPIDIIEGLAWGNEGQWGYHKHPALSPWLMDMAAQVSGSADWVQYLLSQLSVCAGFVGMWLLAREFLTSKQALISILLLEGIYYHGYSSPEFNANVILLPFWSWAIYAFYKAVQSKHVVWWILLGGVAALGILGKYFTGFLLISMFGYLLLTKQGRQQFTHWGPYAALVTLIVLLLPHLMWMIETEFSTLSYGVNRAAGKEVTSLANHLVYPTKFFVSQLILLIPPLLMLAAFGFKRGKTTATGANTALLNFVAFGPLLLILLLSLTLGWKLRSMWGTPLFMISGLMLVYYLRPILDPVRFSRFAKIFLFFALIGPLAYGAVYGIRPLVKDNGKRTQFPGPEIAEQVSAQWQEHYPDSPLNYVIGDVWRAGNVSYYSDLSSLPGKRAPSVFIDGNLSTSPWIDPAHVTQSGAVIIWKVKTADPTEDPRYHNYKKLFPGMIDMPPLNLQWDSWFSDKSLTIHWAILPPKP